MRVGLISDIHGNLTALDAVLAALQREKPDAIVCLGDVAAFGPQPRETVERLRERNFPTVMGNADDWLLTPRRSPDADDDLRRIEEIDGWCGEQLANVDLAYLHTFRPTVEVSLGLSDTLLCYHGSPGSFDDIILATTPDDELSGLLAGFRATVMAGGHTHAQMLRRHGDAYVLNPGSVGLPFYHDRRTGRAVNPPWAEYATISWDDAGLAIELRRVAIDVEAVVRSALHSGMPHAEWWAQDWTG